MKRGLHFLDEHKSICSCFSVSILFCLMILGCFWSWYTQRSDTRGLSLTPYLHTQSCFPKIAVLVSRKFLFLSPCKPHALIYEKALSMCSSVSFQLRHMQANAYWVRRAWAPRSYRATSEKEGLRCSILKFPRFPLPCWMRNLATERSVYSKVDVQDSLRRMRSIEVAGICLCALRRRFQGRREPAVPSLHGGCVQSVGTHAVVISTSLVKLVAPKEESWVSCFKRIFLSAGTAAHIGSRCYITSSLCMPLRLSMFYYEPAVSRMRCWRGCSLSPASRAPKKEMMGIVSIFLSVTLRGAKVKPAAVHDSMSCLCYGLKISEYQIVRGGYMLPFTLATFPMKANDCTGFLHVYI